MRYDVILSRDAVEDLRHLSEEDRFDWELANDPRFLQRIEAARQDLQSGGGVRLEDVEE